MIARLFHEWERRLASVATNRVARPFEWGTDWLADQHLPPGDPRRVLQAWGQATVADSDAFYAASPADDYSLTGDILTFTSALDTPHPQNNTVRARYFPDPYSGALADARRMFVRVCGYMKVDPNRFDLDVVPDDSIRGAVGLYYQDERPRIVLAQAQLLDPERLVATIAHEVAHDVLLGGGLISPQEPDHEQITDLVPARIEHAQAPVFGRNSHSPRITHSGQPGLCAMQT